MVAGELVSTQDSNEGPKHIVAEESYLRACAPSDVATDSGNIYVM